MIVARLSTVYFVPYKQCLSSYYYSSCAVLVKTFGGSYGNAVSSANSQSATDEPHPQHAAQPPQQTAVTTARHGEGRR